MTEVSPTDSTVQTSISDGVATVRFARNHRLNPMNVQMLNELSEAVQGIQSQDEVRVAVIAGAASAFCVGVDVKEFGTLDSAGKEAFVAKESALFALLERSSILSVAVIRGVCYGTGLELALACDFRVAAADALLAYPEIRAGFAGPANRLSRYVGVGIAKEILYSGRNIEAPEALSLGLLSQVVDSDEVDSVVTGLAAGYAALAVNGVRVTKERVTSAYHLGAVHI